MSTSGTLSRVPQAREFTEMWGYFEKKICYLRQHFMRFGDRQVKVKDIR